MPTAYLYAGAGKPGVWSDPNNWGGYGAPGPDDTAVIKTAMNGPIAGVVSINNLMLFGSEAITFMGTMNTAGVGNCAGMMICVGASATFAPGAVLNDGGILLVGVGSSGQFTAQGKGALHSVIDTDQAVLGADLNGVGVVTIDDAVWTNQAGVVVGRNGSGALSVLDNARATIGGSLAIGEFAQASGTVNVASGSALNVAGAVQLGSGDAGGSVGALTIGASSSVTVGQELAVMPDSTVTMAGGTLTAGVAVEAGGTLSGSGMINVPAGSVIVDNGTITATGGTLKLSGNVAGTGKIQIGNDSTLQLKGFDTPKIAFIGSNGTLSLGQQSTVYSEVDGFTAGDHIAVTAATWVAWNASAGVLTIGNGAQVAEVIHLGGIAANQTFSLTQTGHAALITTQIPSAAAILPIGHS